MANVLHFKLIAVTIIVTITQARLIERDCSHDHDCKPHEFCDASAQLCQSCVDCGIYNRQFGVVICPKTARECGNCFTGYDVPHSEKLENTEICEKGNRIFSRKLSSTNETDSNEDESDAVATWVYVVCVIAGLCVGFAVGGVGGILAYKLYFQRKRQRKSKNKDEKCYELHEMLSETRKQSSSSLERGEIAYGLITNNTKHFSNVKNPDSRLDQEVIPLQGNTAPVVSNSLYYADEDKRI